MLLTITCEAPRATDLGHLLHKNPANVFEKETSFGWMRVFYPEATDERCTAALVLDVDPIALVRGAGSTLDQYVNDRPYVASSLLSVAIGDAFGTALGGRSKERQGRVDERMRLTARLAAVRCPAGEPLVRRLLEPLGYTVTVTRADLDARFPEWGESDVYGVVLSGEQTVRALLAHLYVLIPVMDNSKHYYVGEEEIEKLLRRGEGWLADHPEKELITTRYLAYRRPYVRAALEALRDDAPVDEVVEEAEEQRVEEPERLNDLRLATALAAVRAVQPAAHRVLDLGCGEGRMLRLLLREAALREIVGVDVSSVALSHAERNLHLDRMPERQRERLRLLHGSLLYRDDRFAGFDVALLLEVIEHVDAPRIRALEQVVFGHAKPRRVVVTTPNAEYNTMWPSLPAGRFRHRDHRFEWTRAEFREWASHVATGYGYAVTYQDVGPVDAGCGAPTQMAVLDAHEGARA